MGDTTQLHNEALRKVRVFQRAKEARGRMGIEGEDMGQGNKLPVYQPETMNFLNKQSGLQKYKVNDDGFNNRYRNNASAAPHTDHAYRVLYPDSDNSDYTCEPNRNNRIHRVKLSDFEIRRRVNGDFDMRVLMDQTVPAVAPK